MANYANNSLFYINLLQHRTTENPRVGSSILSLATIFPIYIKYLKTFFFYLKNSYHYFCVNFVSKQSIETKFKPRKLLI